MIRSLSFAKKIKTSRGPVKQKGVLRSPSGGDLIKELNWNLTKQRNTHFRVHPNKLFQNKWNSINTVRVNSMRSDTIPNILKTQLKTEPKTTLTGVECHNEFKKMFKVVKMIGNGSNSKVYLARQRTTRKLYAVKKLSKNIIKDNSNELSNFKVKITFLFK
jgi:hypothetical protein